MGDRVNQVIAGVAHHQPVLLEAAIVDEDGSQPAVTDQHEGVCGLVKAGMAASGCWCVNWRRGEPGCIERFVCAEPFMPALTGVLFDWREIRLVEVVGGGHLSNGIRGLVHRRLVASGCKAVRTDRWPVLPLGTSIRATVGGTLRSGATVRDATHR